MKSWKVFKIQGNPLNPDRVQVTPPSHTHTCEEPGAEWLHSETWQEELSCPQRWSCLCFPNEAQSLCSTSHWARGVAVARRCSHRTPNGPEKQQHLHLMQTGSPTWVSSCMDGLLLAASWRLWDVDLCCRWRCGRLHRRLLLCKREDWGPRWHWSLLGTQPPAVRKLNLSVCTLTFFKIHHVKWTAVFCLFDRNVAERLQGRQTNQRAEIQVSSRTEGRSSCSDCRV